MNQLRKALELAYEKHSGQLDKAGKPYILHPLMVALNYDYLEGENEKVVAILHDIIEDTDVTEQQLLDMGFNSEVVRSVSLLTKPNDMDYFDYIRRIKHSNSSIAHCVKVADLTENSDLSRLDNITEKDIKRKEKYQKALDILYGNRD